MNPFSSNSRGPSSEFERISLDDLSRPDANGQPQTLPPADTNPSVARSLSPARPIILPRVSLRRANPTGTSASHWRQPSYSRVDSSANPKIIAQEPSRQYDEEGGVEPDPKELQEGLNVALGTGTDLGNWLPTTRRPSFRRVEQLPTPPQIVVEDTAADDAFEPDERETAGLTVNASQIAGAPSVGPTRLPSTRRPRVITAGLLGSNLGAVERGGSSGDVSLSSTAPSSELEAVSPGGNSVIRHLRKASQRVVNIANADDQAEMAIEFPFPGASPKLRPSTAEAVQEFPFPSLNAPISPIDKLSTEFNVSETGHSPWIDTVELRGNSLGIFGPNNRIRNWLCNLLLHSYVHLNSLII
jgi:hypothetical protein